MSNKKNTAADMLSMQRMRAIQEAIKASSLKGKGRNVVGLGLVAGGTAKALRMVYAKKSGDSRGRQTMLRLRSKGKHLVKTVAKMADRIMRRK